MNYDLLKKISRILTSVFIGIFGIVLIVSVVHLYFTGSSNPYSRERVANYLIYSVAPATLTLISVIFAGVLSLLYPDNKPKATSRIPPRIALSRLKLRFDENKCDPQTMILINKHRTKRIILFSVGIGSALIYTVLSLILALDFSRYTIAEANSAIVGVCILIIPFAAVLIGIISTLFSLYEESIVKESKIIKEAISSGAALQNARAESISTIKRFAEKNDKYIKLGVRISVLTIAIVFITVGIFNGGMSDVLGKAVRICTECIGLG